MTEIYGKYAHDYRRKGYSPLPLPPGLKTPPPSGWTGAGAYMASGSDIQYWIDEHPENANIALRLPDNVIGIDIDNYHGKQGIQTMKDAIAAVGVELPSTGYSTSRSGGSGIRLFRVPSGTKLAGTFAAAGFGPDIEIIQNHHRYTVAPGSVHPEGGTYRWFDKATKKEGELPAVADLPELPVEWIEALQPKKAEPREEIPHDAYDQMSPELKKRVDGYVAASVNDDLAKIDALKKLVGNQKNEDKLGWELGVLEYTRSLATLVKADWNPLQELDLADRLRDALPVDSGFSMGAGWSKFARAVKEENEACPPRTWPQALEDARIELEFDWYPKDARRVGFPEADGSDEAPPAEPIHIEADPDDWPSEPWNEEGHVARTERWAAGALRWLADEQVWVRYNGTHWERDPQAGAKAAERAMKVARWTEQENYDDRDKVDDKTGEVKAGTSERAKFVKALSDQSTDRMFNSVARVLGRREAVESLSTDFDTEEMLLGVANGTVDLRTGQLIAGTPEQMISMSCPVAYEPSATAPRFHEYLAESIPSEDVRNYLQRVIGYSITGWTLEQSMFMHYGEATNNGKSVLINIMSRLLSDYAGVADPKALIESRNDQHTTHIAGLAGPRMLMMSETARGARLSDVLVKNITGDDQVKARKMHKDGQAYRIIGKIHMATNHLPHIVSSASTNRRIHVIPWTVQIENDKIDLQLTDKICRTELPGVLNWAVEGAKLWWDAMEKSQGVNDGERPSGLGMPAEVRVATDAYLGDEDEIGRWLEERTETNSTTFETSSNLYDNYKWWAERAGGKPMTQTSFCLDLKKRGIDQDRKKSARGFILTLRPIQDRSYFSG